jgi:hypothetical protein
VNFSEILHKKVVGVPVLYIGAGAVTILAVVAWRMKALPDTDTAGVDAADGTAGTDTNPDNALAGTDGAYDSYNGTGTVIVQPSVPTGVDVDTTIDTNDEWVKNAAEWLVAQKKATGTDAYTALTKYVSGEDLSFDQGALVNAAIAEKGQPPDPLGTIGTISAAPAQKQFSVFPGRHVVKGPNDNTPTKLAQLYYGSSDAAHINKIVAENPKLGPASATYPVGTSLYIARWVNPGYYVADKNHRSAKLIAAANGLNSELAVTALNPTISFPVAIGTKVRVH